VAFKINTEMLVNKAKECLRSIRVLTRRHNPLVIVMGMVVVFIIVGYNRFLLASPWTFPHIDSSASHNLTMLMNNNVTFSTNYKDMLDKMGTGVMSNPLREKCASYFDDLNKLNENWETIESGVNNSYIRGIVAHDDFIRFKVDWYKKEHNNEEPSEGEKAQFEQVYSEMEERMKTSEQAAIDAVTHLRVYDQCFLRDQVPGGIASIFGGSHKGSSSNLCYELEKKLFPWLSRELPIFKRWDGTVRTGIPTMSKFVDADDDDIPTNDSDAPFFVEINPKDGCFMDSWRSNLNGKGIVLSVTDWVEQDAIALIRVLRALNNKLPIQMVHKGDLSEEVQQRIVEVARSEEFQVPLFLYGKIRDEVPKEFPKQEVWFVDVKECISEKYRRFRSQLSDKLVAYLFNSFDDTLLMDTGSVPLVKPSYFFNMRPYERTSTIFFKDRFTSVKGSKSDSDFFAKLMPTAIDTAMFGIPKVSSFTLDQNRYMKNQYQHVMDAGVIGIKRSSHFIGIVLSVQMNYWVATASRTLGEYEFFWLGQSISGNENYEFNKHNAVAVGELTPLSKRPQNTIGHELCSTNVGHLSGDDDHTLLWINSGMRNCKVHESWEGEISRLRNEKQFRKAKELQDSYKQPVKINAALLPPDGDRLVINDKDEPAKGWVNGPSSNYYWVKAHSPLCHNGLQCAYDVIGGSMDPLDHGMYVKYDNVREDIYAYLGKLWLNQDLVPISQYEVELEKAMAEKSQANQDQ
jgi:alpha 1,3-mannosyltransferase